jgi:hypothetical protein
MALKSTKRPDMLEELLKHLIVDKRYKKRIFLADGVCEPILSKKASECSYLPETLVLRVHLLDEN